MTASRKKSGASLQNPRCVQDLDKRGVILALILRLTHGVQYMPIDENVGHVGLGFVWLEMCFRSVVSGHPTPLVISTWYEYRTPVLATLIIYNITIHARKASHVFHLWPLESSPTNEFRSMKTFYTRHSRVLSTGRETEPWDVHF